jgi:hypothetical protein
VHLAPGGKHNMATWRALVPPLLEWMTPRLGYAPQQPVPLAPRRSWPAPGPGARAVAGHHGHFVLRR